MVLGFINRGGGIRDLAHDIARVHDAFGPVAEFLVIHRVVRR